MCRTAFGCACCTSMRVERTSDATNTTMVTALARISGLHSRKAGGQMSLASTTTRKKIANAIARLAGIENASARPKLLFLERRQQWLSELFTLHRRNADGRVLLGTASEEGNRQPATLASRRSSDTPADTELVGGDDVRDRREVHRQVVACASNVEQQEPADAIRGRGVVCDDDRVLSSSESKQACMPRGRAQETDRPCSGQHSRGITLRGTAWRAIQAKATSWRLCSSSRRLAT